MGAGVVVVGDDGEVDLGVLLAVLVEEPDEPDDGLGLETLGLEPDVYVDPLLGGLMEAADEREGR